jgi:hypothetical protein
LFGLYLFASFSVFFLFFTACLLVADIMAQCSRLPQSATSSTVAVCAYLLDVQHKDTQNSSELKSAMGNLAKLLSNETSPAVACLDDQHMSSTDPHSYSTMQGLLEAIANTESRDPRDATAAATQLLTICYSHCKATSDAFFIAIASEVHTSQSSNISLLSVFAEFGNPRSDRALLNSFCTNPLIALLWEHATKSPRECSDALISSISETLGLSSCALSSLLPAYIAVCDDKAIQCEEHVLTTQFNVLDSCGPMFQRNATCSEQCGALAQGLADSKCLEHSYSIQDAVYSALHQGCSKLRELLFHFLFFSVSVIRCYFPRAAEEPARFFCIPLRLPCNRLTLFSAIQRTRESEWVGLSDRLNHECSLARPFPSTLLRLNITEVLYSRNDSGAGEKSSLCCALF